MVLRQMEVSGRELVLTRELVQYMASLGEELEVTSQLKRRKSWLSCTAGGLPSGGSPLSPRRHPPRRNLSRSHPLR